MLDYMLDGSHGSLSPTPFPGCLPIQPTANPTGEPTSRPTMDPTVRPTGRPDTCPNIRCKVKIHLFLIHSSMLDNHYLKGLTISLSHFIFISIG
jgi:hypothetical protein